MQSQGTQRQLSQSLASTDREQLQRSAEMFEMILKTSPDAVENYLSLKDIYRRLKRDTDYRRIVKGLAEVYLTSNQQEEAATQYTDLLELDPNDHEALTKLQQIGYTPADIPLLQAEVKLKELRGRHQQKSRELQEAEEAFLKTVAEARSVRRGEDKETCALLQAVEEQAENEIQSLVAEHERWLKSGRAEVFNQVAKRLRTEADKIIQGNEFDNIRKSVKEAEKLLDSTDRVFQQEWQQISEEHDKDFHQKIEELRRKKEEQFRSIFEKAIARAEQQQSAADLALRQVKEEMRQLDAELKENEKLLQKIKKAAPQQPPPRLPLKDKPPTPEVVVVAPPGLPILSEPSEGTSPEPPAPIAPKDEVGKTLGAILVQHGLVTREHLEQALAKQREDHRPIGEILVHCGYATEENIINALVAQAGVPYLPLANYQVSDEVAMIIPRELALRYTLMPVDKIASTLLLAMGIPLSQEQKKEVQRHVGDLRISYFISSWPDIKAKHKQHYG